MIKFHLDKKQTCMKPSVKFISKVATSVILPQNQYIMPQSCQMYPYSFELLGSSLVLIAILYESRQYLYLHFIIFVVTS